MHHLYLFSLIILFFGNINTSPIHHHHHYRHRRQINPPSDIPSARVSGSIPGTYYYGIGSDPNYGSFVQRPNRVGGGNIVPISYNSNSNLYQNLVRQSHNHAQQQKQKLQSYLYNNNNNNNNNYAWLKQNMNNNPYQYYNRYAPGSQGWYATGSNYWFNDAKSLIACPYLLLISITLLVFYT